MPEPKSMLEATSEANNLASLSEAKETYMRGMEEVCGAERPYINEHVLEIEHLRIHDTALEVFNSRRKMGGEEFSTKFREKLESDIQESFDNLKVSPSVKNFIGQKFIYLFLVVRKAREVQEVW
jgi:atlastin